MFGNHAYIGWQRTKKVIFYKDKIELPFDEGKLTFNSTWLKGKRELSFILNVSSSMKAFKETRNKS